MDTTQMLYLAGAFVLGFIVAWFAGRNGPKRGLEECEANAHSLQRSLDERTRSVSKLETQLKEQVAQVDRLGSEGGKLSAALSEAEAGAAQAAAQIAQLQMEVSQSQSEQLRLEAELGHVRGAYADTRTRLAALFAESEAQTAAAAEAAIEAETTALAVAGAIEVEQLAAQVQALEIELEAVRANAARLAGQAALRPQLSSTQQQEYAGLAGDPVRVVAALHERDMAVADARAEADYLRRTVGMLTGMGAELAGEVERRRREQQVLVYQVAGLTAVTREVEMRQLVDRQAPLVQTGAQAAQTPAGTIEPEGHDLPVSTRPDNALEPDNQPVVATLSTQTPAGTIEPEGHDLPVDTRPDNALEPESEAGAGAGSEDLAAVALDLRQQLDERSQELEELRTQTAPLQANLDELQAELEAINAAKADLEAQLEARDSDFNALQSKLEELQAESESVAAAKAALAEQLQTRRTAWQGLAARLVAVNADLDALVAAEPVDEGATQDSAPADELVALAAAAPAENAVPEAARAADAAAPAAENAEAATADESKADVDAGPALDKLAAGVAAAVALFGRKNARLAGFEQQVNDLASEKNALETTLAAKADVEAQLEARGGELSELQTRLAELQSQAESVAAAKSALEANLQTRGAAWSSLLAGVSAVNADLDALVAAEPVELAESEEVQAAGATGEAQASAPPAELAAEVNGDDSAASDGENSIEDASDAEGQAVIAKLAAGVTAAVALFKRKNGKLAELAQQMDALAGDKNMLQSTLDAKDESLVATQAKVEQLHAGLNQRSQRFDALSMHASSLEADMEIRQIERAKLEERVRAVAAELKALSQSYAAAPVAETALVADEPTAAVGQIATVAATGAEPAAASQGEIEATPAAPQSTLDELAAAAAAVAGLLRSRDGDLQAARAQLDSLQGQLGEHSTARQALAAELENKGLGLADIETRLQSLQGEYSGVQAAQGDLQATLQTLGAQLRDYLAEYGEPPAPEAADATTDATTENAGSGSPVGAVAAVAAIGELLKRRKDDLDGANARIGDLDAEISAMTSQRSELDTQAEQQEQALADLSAQLEAAQAELAAHIADAEALKQQVTDLTAQLEAAQTNAAAQTADAEALKQQAAELTAQLETAQADIASRTTDADTLRNQLDALQAQATATEQERARLDAQLRLLDENLAQLGLALDADDETTLTTLAQRLGAEEAPAEGATRSIDAPLLKVGGAVAVAGIAGKKLADLRAASAQLSALQQEYAALTAAKSDLESQLQSQTEALAAIQDEMAATKSELESQLQSQTEALAATKAQLAGIQDDLAAANAQHADELQVLDAKMAGLQSQYNEAEAERLRLEGSLAALNGDLQQLGAVLENGDDEGLQQFVQKMAPAPIAAADSVTDGATDGEPENGNGAIKVLGVAAVAAAVQRKQAALKEADERAALIQAQLDEVSADREAAKTLLADRDQALQQVETRLTEATLQTEAVVSDFKTAARAAAAERGIEVQMVRSLQDFAALKHIGVTFEQRLYRAGAGTFWEVAHLTDEDFAIILRLTEMQQLAMDLNETRADAVRMAEETNTLGAISEGETPDDFEPIQGIGKVFEQRLYSAGIRTYWDLANASEDQLAAICKARRPLIPDYASWIRQARILMEVRSEQ